MAVPKNYNQLEKRVESLNDLMFYNVLYEYEFTESFKDDLENKHDEQEVNSIVESISGVKKFTALNDELADKKVNEWLGGLVENDILEDYKVIEMKSHGFYEEMKDKKLDGILNLGKGT